MKSVEKRFGFIIINKVSGPTSHDVIDELRKIIGIRKIGHAGTLDPFASGVLICAVGREATKRIREFAEMDKEYVADIVLGKVSDTYDRTGKITISEKSGGTGQCPVGTGQCPVRTVLKEFIGKQKQLVPAYSATKVGGKKMYELARAGKKIFLPPTEIEIYDIELLKYKWPSLKIKVKCSSGTYIRTLAHDIGQKLGTGAYLKELQRTAIGDYKINRAVSLEKLNKDNWQDYLFNLPN